MSTLIVTNREISTQGDLRKQRDAKFIPAILYGLKKDSVSVKIEEAELRKYLKLKNKNTILDLSVDGKVEQVIVKEYVYHPIKRSQVIHIDFLRVDDKQPVTVKVPIEYYGTPCGVKNQGGQFTVMKRFVKLRCLASLIPESFKQDISDLNAEDVFYVRDLSFENGTFVTPGKVSLYGVSKSRGQQEEEMSEVNTEEAGE